MRLAVCVPFRDTVTRTKFALALGRMAYPTGDWHIFSTEKAYYDEARNVLVREALLWGATHMLHLDDDMIPPPNITQLLADWNVDIVAALYFQRRYPFLSTMMQFDGQNYLASVNGPIVGQGLQEAAVGGLGCLFVNAEVYKAMKVPWYVYNDWSLGLKRSSALETITEDVSFCLRARKEGFKVYVDTNIVIPHCGDEGLIGYEEHLAAYQKWTKEIKKP